MSVAFVSDLFNRAGVTPNGDREFDPRVHQDRFYRRVATAGFLGLAEAYIDGDWDCGQLDRMLEMLIASGAHPRLRSGSFAFCGAFCDALRARLMNLQSPSRAAEVCEKHYDLGNDLFSAMLDPRLTYTCGYWKDVPPELDRHQALAHAQEAKLDLVCRKLGLKPGMRLLDVGCGFGSLMNYAAEKYGVECVGYSLSAEQTARGRELSRGKPITFMMKDYREIEGRFDRIASIGMFEAVGSKNYRRYMETLLPHLEPNGLFLLHTVGGHQSQVTPEPFFDRYIFPNGQIPSAAQITAAAEGVWSIEDWHSFGEDYDRTLRAWHANFLESWPSLAPRYGERFKRVWEFYLLSMAAAFRARYLTLWQIVFTPIGGRPSNPVRHT